IQTITRQAALADSNPGTPPDSGCIPGGTTGSTLALVVVTDRNNVGTSSTGASTPVRQKTYCYYAGNGTGTGTNGTTAGVLCQRMVDEDGNVNACGNLLAMPQAGATRPPGSTPISLVLQTAGGDAYVNSSGNVILLQPALPSFCPRT